MKQHGLKEEDVAEDVMEIVDGSLDNFREWLAKLVADLCDCTVVVHKRDGIALKGSASKVQQAKGIYQSGLSEMQSSRMPPIAPWFEQPASVIWKFCWWRGFASVMKKGRQQPQKRSFVAQVAEAVKKDSPEVDLLSSAFTLQSHINLDWLQREAYSAGCSAGERVSSNNAHVLVLRS